MNWTLPTTLLLFAGDVALCPLVSAVRQPVSLQGLVAEVFAATLAIIALVWRGWIMLWLIEQRW